MVELLGSFGSCDKLPTSRRFLHPRVKSEQYGKALMIIDLNGRKLVDEVLQKLVSTKTIPEHSYEELGDNVFLVPRSVSDSLQPVSVRIGDRSIDVYFVEYSTDHENHWGRCTPELFSCGSLRSDLWIKIIDGLGANPFSVTRSYHMDCEPDWMCQSSDEEIVVTDEQQAMMDLGLPVNFGLSGKKKYNDYAVVDENTQMIDKDYDKEITSLRSSTEQLSVSEVEEQKTAEQDGNREALSKKETKKTFEEFTEYWLANCEKIVAERWDPGEHPSLDSEAYASEWEEHSWKVYYDLMYEMVKESDIPETQQLSGSTSDQKTGSQSLPEPTEDPQDPPDSNLPNETDQNGDPGGEANGSGDKRPLALDDFGLASSEGCSIEQIHSKGRVLKKLKKESYNHRKEMNARSADALDDNGGLDVRLAKYWSQRYRLFRKFDSGIQLDDESWYSVTPEKIAEHIAARTCPRSKRKSMVVVDSFCGVGGNTIQFAQRGQIVLSIDIDLKKLEMAKNNARIYGVEHKIDFILADATSFVPRIAPDLFFMSPPWGGPEYQAKETFDLKEIPVDFGAIFRMYKELTPNIAALLPRNTDLKQLCELGRVEVEQNFLNNKVKTITAYYGQLICTR